MADTKTFTNYADPGYFSNLNEVLPKELVDKYQDRFFYYDVPDDEQGEGESIVAGKGGRNLYPVMDRSEAY